MPFPSMILLVFIIVFLFLLFYFVPVGMWVQGVVSLGLGRITIIDLIRMRLRKIRVVPRLFSRPKPNSTWSRLEKCSSH